ncbi:MAG: hypothetical protein WCF33_17960 [Pseudonocardiaceae bacterium]
MQPGDPADHHLGFDLQNPVQIGNALAGQQWLGKTVDLVVGFTTSRGDLVHQRPHTRPDDPHLVRGQVLNGQAEQDTGHVLLDRPVDQELPALACLMSPDQLLQALWVRCGLHKHGDLIVRIDTAGCASSLDQRGALRRWPCAWWPVAHRRRQFLELACVRFARKLRTYGAW